MTARSRIALGLLAAALGLAAQGSAAPPPPGAIDAWGLVQWNSNGAFTEPGSASGIAQTTLLADGRIIVEFSSPYYQSLKSTVLVSCRSTVPCFINWDTFGSNSVQVYLWDKDGNILPAGAFSIALIRRPGVREVGRTRDEAAPQEAQ